MKIQGFGGVPGAPPPHNNTRPLQIPVRIELKDFGFLFSKFVSLCSLHDF